MVISTDAEKAFVHSKHEHVPSPQGLPQCVQSLRLNDLKTENSPHRSGIVFGPVC